MESDPLTTTKLGESDLDASNRRSAFIILEIAAALK
jgi:hypothetical protein